MQRITVLALVCALSLPALPAFALAAPITRTLTVGDSGKDVISLQETLTLLGHFYHGATGYFGINTYGSVVAFQEIVGLEPVGIVGPKTRALINLFLTDEEVVEENSPPPPPELTEPAVYEPEPPVVYTAPTETVIETDGATDDSLVITVTSPLSLLPRDTQYATMEVSTNKNASCRFGTNPLMEFTRKTAFKNTGGTAHSHEFSGLSNGSLYVYYVQCEDSENLVLTDDVIVSFSIATQAASNPSALVASAAHAFSIGPWSFGGILDALFGSYDSF